MYRGTEIEYGFICTFLLTFSESLSIAHQLRQLADEDATACRSFLNLGGVKNVVKALRPEVEEVPNFASMRSFYRTLQSLALMPKVCTRKGA